MNKFESSFFKMLNEQDVDKEAMQSTLEPETDASEFDVNVEPSEDTNNAAAKAAEAIAQRNSAMVDTIQGWVTSMEEFLDKLNGQGPNSIQTVLANSEPDTILDRMKQSEQRKIARVATEIAALNESFKGYLAQTANPQFKYV